MKYLIKKSLMICTLMMAPSFAMAQVYYEDDEGAEKSSKTTQVEVQKENKAEKIENSDSRLDASDFNSFTLCYVAAFKTLNKGRYGYDGHFYGFLGRFVGLTYGLYMDIGINDPATWGFHVGPNFCVPITKNFYVYAPLLGNFSWCDKVFVWSIDLVPTLSVKLAHITLSAGVDLGWTKGMDTIGTALYVGLGFSL